MFIVFVIWGRGASKTAFPRKSVGTSPSGFSIKETFLFKGNHGELPLRCGGVGMQIQVETMSEDEAHQLYN